MEPTTQARRAVVSYSSYREAERAVDLLADNRFPEVADEATRLLATQLPNRPAERYHRPSRPPPSWSEPASSAPA